MTLPLENLSGPGKQLSAEPTDPRELEGLTRSGLARLGHAFPIPGAIRCYAKWRRPEGPSPLVGQRVRYSVSLACNDTPEYADSPLSRT